MISEPIDLNGRLQQNYPNPFNPSTIIDYNVPMEGKVSIVVYDLMGRAVVNKVIVIK